MKRYSSFAKGKSMGDAAVTLVDCFSVVHMHLAPTNPDACLGARAAIRAAEIQAKATRSSGTDTLLAGLAALGGGLLTIASALYALRKEVRLTRFKQRVFISKLLTLLTSSKKELGSLLFSARDLANKIENKNYPNKILYKSSNLRFIENIVEYLSINNIFAVGNFGAHELECFTKLESGCSNIIFRYKKIVDIVDSVNEEIRELHFSLKYDDFDQSEYCWDLCKDIESSIDKIHYLEASLSERFGRKSHAGSTKTDK